MFNPARDRLWAVAGGGLLLVAAVLAGVRQFASPFSPSAALRHAVEAGGRADRGSAERIVVPIFRVRDCPALIEAMAALSKAHDEGTVQVHGLLVADGDTEGQLEALRRGARLRFPISTVSQKRGGLLVTSLGYRTTPVLIVMDREYRLKIVQPLAGPSPHRAVSGLLRDPGL